MTESPCLPPPGTASGTTHVLRCDRGAKLILEAKSPTQAIAVASALTTLAMDIYKLITMTLEPPHD